MLVSMETGVNDAIVIGGGFAGIAAACRLAGDGHRPLLIERAPRLGGRASSFVSRETGESIDFGQHVLMRCCTTSTGFLLRIGLPDAIRFQPTLSVPIVSPEGRTLLRSSAFPGIFHLAPALLRFRLLPFSERVRVLRAGLALALTRARTDRSFAEWLAAHGQSPAAVERLWDPISIATLNAPSDAVGLHAARKVFRDAFFRPDGADLGFFTFSLSEVFTAARRYIENRGGTVRTSDGVRLLIVEEGRIAGVELESGEQFDSEAVVCAVPPPALEKLAGSDGPLEPILEAASRLRWGPIVNLHAWFDRPVLDEAFSVAVGSPAQAVFDVTQLHGGSPGGLTHVVLSQSAADEWIDRPVEDVSTSLLNALGELFPAVRAAKPCRTLVLRSRQATFIPEPSVDRLRPRAPTPIDGLYLAGDWISTGWPSTIEGAIRSGIVAAAYVEERLRVDRLVDDGDE